MSKKIIIAGGGTGGHIYPAIAIANGIKQTVPNAKILFIGSERGMEKDLVPKAGFELRTIRIKGFRRKLSLDTLSSIKELIYGMRASWKILFIEKPDLVIGTGGYVAGPVLFLASLAGIKTMIHEQNVKPGITNKILSMFVDKIAISFKDAHRYFPKKKTFFSGNPIRPEILRGCRSEALRKFGLREDLPVVLCFGGSQGASSINNAMINLISNVKDDAWYQIIHITGKGQFDDALEQLTDKGILAENLGHIKVLPYVYNMGDAYAAADIVVSRAGALTISEISMCAKPSILVPLKKSAGDHQNHNAKYLKDKGASLVLRDTELTSNSLANAIEHLIDNEVLRKNMATSSRVIAEPKALDIIVDQICDLLRY